MTYLGAGIQIVVHAVTSNYFESVNQPLTPASYANGGQIYYIQTVEDASNGQSTLGYIYSNILNTSPLVFRLRPGWPRIWDTAL
ncbi:unnamed protein product [Clonostachys rosea f. rosea IK726]|uniref:Uncharacterized protein n=1 Tax=Clonostachys rosea f. rosea IK726 TaxID=1349383 RepID=A0ACA9TZI4_BIOOC|nr:unnamed protein product [Clonostachys rosea f. rosea IK726]